MSKPSMQELQKCGQRLLDAAVEYHKLANRAGVYGGVIWIKGTDGELVIVTDGQYNDRLLENIERTGPTLYFGHTVDE